MTDLELADLDRTLVSIKVRLEALEAWKGVVPPRWSWEITWEIGHSMWDKEPTRLLAGKLSQDEWTEVEFQVIEEGMDVTVTVLDGLFKGTGSVRAPNFTDHPTLNDMIESDIVSTLEGAWRKAMEHSRQARQAAIDARITP